jgi:hypothetical protein
LKTSPLEEDLWRQLAEFLQAQWMSLTDAFIETRRYDQFTDDPGLKELLPIRRAHANDSLAGPASPSSTIIVARSDAH